MYIYSLTYEGILHMNRHLTYPVHQVPAPAEVPVPRRRIARAGRPNDGEGDAWEYPRGIWKKKTMVIGFDITYEIPMNSFTTY